MCRQCKTGKVRLEMVGERLQESECGAAGSNEGGCSCKPWLQLSAYAHMIFSCCCHMGVACDRC